MKFKVLGLMLLVLLLANNLFAQGSIIDDGIAFIDAHAAQASVFYNVPDKEVIELVGVIVVNDLWVKKLDLSANWDGDKAVVATLDYTLKESDTIEPFVQAGVGLDRIEGTDRREWGDAFWGVGAGIRF